MLDSLQLAAGLGSVWQALLGTLFTWGLTAAGSALVFVFTAGQRAVLDASLGFAAGVMLAASYWSLLAPAIELSSGYGSLAFIPVGTGFLAGALFVCLADYLLPVMGVVSMTDTLTSQQHAAVRQSHGSKPASAASGHSEGGLRHRSTTSALEEEGSPVAAVMRSTPSAAASWRRMVLLMVAITVHNIPEGLAVGVGFGAIGKTPLATYERACNLALGIGIQNFPEGLAVSLPLRAAGIGPWTSFWYGQLSGMVEPLAGVFGAVAIVVAEPLLPYALSFAAGAMVLVVVDDIIPEAHSSGNGRLSSYAAIAGFLVMMSLDVGLG